jgi:hypothetical protein
VLALIVAGCGGESYTPNPPQPDTSLEVGDKGVLQYAGVRCNSVDLYKLGVGEATAKHFDTMMRALDRGDCTPEDEENLSYEVVDIGPIEEDFTGCKLIYMTTIVTEKYGNLYISSDDIPGTAPGQMDYRVDCLKKLRDQES